MIARPLISSRLDGTHSYSPAASKENSPPLHEVLRFKWRSLVESLAEYQRWIYARLRRLHKGSVSVLVALFPRALVKACLVLCYSVLANRRHCLGRMKRSRFYMGNRRDIKRAP